ncbi:MAG: tryptophan--tRNA ligase [Ancrocorticia sp.]|jgi:tryptophanyl-tRNA synthetase|nr:tryptophan--tRNA ligase [Ancrocorticia sp.]MCI1932455.1 tryptophan--tRNA ligase [Ancrocorticia sp.]MCI1964143.1 tryptophan--tRNA ligase [Ancrocorticia sp.]MCI2002580.1 tryptophan--tRNA ligase [Ancrocorticia sp.]MCI2012591.1 tryptophan--tRNA ligase [Ancrocorticia sp.]
MTTSFGDTLENATSAASLAHSRAVSQKIEKAIAEDPSEFRVLTGDRPTGNLHIGHFFGSLQNRVRLQQAGVDTWLVIADFQVITDRDGVGPIKERVYSLTTDYLAVGIDPQKATIFPHSQVEGLNQLMLPFLSLVTDAELRRNPTVKAELEATGNRPMSGLLLTYPVHQAADILFCKANIVPVGKDQLPHLEQARVIADRFESRFGHPAGSDKPVFARPQALLSEAEMVLGLDGTKMSKSKGNTIELRMSADETARRIRKAVTDSERFITFDPENRPEVSNLLRIAGMCQNRDPRDIAAEIGNGGAGMLKKVVTESLNELLAPVRARRAELEKNQDFIREVLRHGIEVANERAEQTQREVREAMNMVY